MIYWTVYGSLLGESRPSPKGSERAATKGAALLTTLVKSHRVVRTEFCTAVTAS